MSLHDIEQKCRAKNTIITSSLRSLEAKAYSKHPQQVRLTKHFYEGYIMGAPLREVISALEVDQLGTYLNA